MTLQLFFTNKTKTISSQFFTSTHTGPPNQLDPLLKLPYSPSVPSLRRKYPNFSSPAILQLSSRPYPLHPSSKQSPCTLTSTHTPYQHISPHRHLPHCIQAGSGNPHCSKKPTLNTFSFSKTTDLSLSFHSLPITRTSCLQPGLIVSFTEQQTEC